MNTTAASPPSLSLVQKLGWALSLLIPALLLTTVSGDGLTREMIVFSAITAWAVVCWATEILPAPMVGIILPTVYFAAKLAPAPIALAKPFATVIPWAVIGALMIGIMAQKTGLAKRIVLKCMVLTGSSYPGLFFAMFLSGIILTPLVPSATAKSAIMLALGVGACDALNLEKGSKEATAVLFASFLSVCAPRFGILTASLENLTITRLMASVTGETVGYADFAMHNLVPAIIYSAISMLMAVAMVRGKGRLNKEALMQQYREMGSITRDELIAAFLAIFAVVLAATQKYHGLPGMHLFVAISALAFVPKINILNGKDFGTVAFPMVFFIAGSLAIGFVAGHVGIGKWLSAKMLPIAQSMDSTFGLSALAYGFGVILNFILTPLAAQALMTVPLTELAISMNMQPYPIIYSFLYGTDQYLFAYEFALLLLFCSTGHLRLQRAVPMLAIRMALTPVFLGLIAIPYWAFVGLN